MRSLIQVWHFSPDSGFSTDEQTDGICSNNEYITKGTCHIIIPPLPLRKCLYRCDNKFHLDMLIPLFKTDEPKNGFILVTGEEAVLYEITGPEFKKITTIHCYVKGNTRRGGQSAPRFQRMRENDTVTYCKKVAEKAFDHFVSENIPTIHHLVLAGPAVKKDLVYERLSPVLQNITSKPLSISGSESIEDLIRMAQDQFETKQETSPWVKRFYEDLELSKGKAVYGNNEIKEKLEQGLLEVLLIPVGDKEKWIKETSKVGCEIIEISQRRLFSNYGDAVGMTWYSIP